MPGLLQHKDSQTDTNSNTSPYPLHAIWAPDDAHWRSIMRPIPSSALSTEILVGAGCIILRSRSADRYQRGCIVVTGLLLGLGQLIPLGDPHRILQFHTRHSSQSDYNRRISSVLPRFPSAVGISGVPLGDLKPVHRRRIPCRRNIWSTWSIARDVRSATLPVELSALFTGSILCAYFRLLPQNQSIRCGCI